MRGGSRENKKEKENRGKLRRKKMTGESERDQVKKEKQREDKGQR